MLGFSLLLATPAICAPATVGCVENPVVLLAMLSPIDVAVPTDAVSPVLLAGTPFWPGCTVDPAMTSAESTTSPAAFTWINRHSSDLVIGSDHRRRMKRT